MHSLELPNLNFQAWLNGHRLFVVNLEMIPTLDLSHFTAGSEQQRRQFADGLLAGLIDTGFVKIINHGLEKKKLDEVFAWVGTSPQRFNMLSSPC